jgi:HEAT repeat protein
VQQAIAKLVSSGAGNLVRANAARAAGVLRNRGALPQLADALRSKDDRLMIEAMDAMQKIADPAIGPRVQFLLRDLEESVQVKAIETTGVLRNRAAWTDLVTAYNRPRTERVRRAALAALAMLGEPQAHEVLAGALEDRDEQVRAAAAEGLGRLKRPADQQRLATLFEAERKMPPRLALAFALTMMGKTELAEFSPLQYLINTLNNRAWRGYSLAYLIEAAREEPVRRALNAAAAGGTRDEQTGLCAVLGASGDKSSVPVLERLTRSSDSEVANEAIRASRNLKARLQ